MTSTDETNAWQLNAFGDLSVRERAAFYDALAEDEVEEHMSFFWDSNEILYENPRLEVAIILPGGDLVAAARCPVKNYICTKTINIILERYYVHAVPGNNFDLQMAISSRHSFVGRKGQERVSHTMAVKGVLKDYVNYISEPVFKGLRIDGVLTLDLAVTFVTDKSTERLLSVLRSPELRKGMLLASGYNPVFGTAATYVKGLVETVATARKNQTITDAHISLINQPGDLSLPLIEGTYVLFQPSAGQDDILNRNPKFDAAMQKIVTSDGAFERNHFILRIQSEA